MMRRAAPRFLLCGAAALVLAIGAASSVMAGGLPDARLTPGDVLPVKAPQICRPGYAPSTLHALTPAEWHKRRLLVFQAYGIGKQQRDAYVINHLIPLEIGGSNEIANLWPLAKAGRWNTTRKAKLVRRLHKLVCSGRLSLQEAQRETAADWIATYRNLVSAR